MVIAILQSLETDDDEKQYYQCFELYMWKFLWKEDIAEF
jgi:hypothetical protein